MLLSGLLLIPFVGTFVLLLWPTGASPQRLRLVTIVILLAQLALSLVVVGVFDPAAAGMQLQEHHSWVPGIGLDYALGVDGLSLPLVLINAALTLVAAVITRPDRAPPGRRPPANPMREAAAAPRARPGGLRSSPGLFCTVSFILSVYGSTDWQAAANANRAHVTNPRVAPAIDPPQSRPRPGITQD